MALAIAAVISTICNMIGYKTSFMESLPGMLILWISLIGSLLASPISPVSAVIIKYTSVISLNAITTPILAYAGIIIGKDWGAFKEVGLKGIIVSIFVIVGTFLISSLMGDFFMGIFN